MKKYSVLIILLALSVLLVSCMSINLDGSPRWTTNPPTSDYYFYGVGMAHESLPIASKTKAQILATADIAKQVSASIKESLADYKEENELDSNFFDNFANEVASVNLIGVEVKETYALEDGSVFVLCRYEKQNLDDVYEKATKKLDKLKASSKNAIDKLLETLDD